MEVGIRLTGNTLDSARLSVTDVIALADAMAVHNNTESTGAVDEV
jgi:hypothetical protein